MRGKGLIKLLKAIDLLSGLNGISVNELADELGIDRRSVYRILHVIQDLNFPVYDEKPLGGGEKRWKLDRGYVKKLPNLTLPDLNLTLSEIVSLYLLRMEAHVFRGTDLEKQADSALEKIGLLAPQGLWDRLKRIRPIFLPSSKLGKDYSGKEDLIDGLMEAMLQKKTCFVTYHSFGDDTVKNFKIDPLYFFENDGGLYVFVRATSFDEIRMLAVERVLSLEATGEDFEYPEDFRPAELLRSAFDIVCDDPIAVRIWFSQDQARYIRERTWAKRQRIQDLIDGSIVLEMETSGWWDVKKWVLSWGGDAMVLEPEALKKEIIDELKAAQRCYASDS